MFNFQDAAEADGVIGGPACAVAAEAEKFNQHRRRLGGVAVAELDGVVLPPLQPLAPVRRLVAVFDSLGAGGDLREEFPVQIQVENGGFDHCH